MSGIYDNYPGIRPPWERDRPVTFPDRLQGVMEKPMEDKTAKALKVLRLLVENGIVKAETVKEFNAALDLIIGAL